MKRTILFTFGFLVLIAVLSLVYGTVGPRTTHATPYFSALSEYAVNTAEACPCNVKICNGSTGSCIPDPNPEDPHACCVQQTGCKSVLCFP